MNLLNICNNGPLLPLLIRNWPRFHRTSPFGTLMQGGGVFKADNSDDRI